MHRPAYRLWQSMLNRCRNPRSTSYANYGGRGITVCQEWQVFETFLADMGERPEGYSLDRKDNSGPYCRENCRWATYKQQARNTRRSRYITAFGETKRLVAWEEDPRAAVCGKQIRKRIILGWPPEEAISSKAKTGKWSRVPREKRNRICDGSWPAADACAYAAAGEPSGSVGGAEEARPSDQPERCLPPVGERPTRQGISDGGDNPFLSGG